MALVNGMAAEDARELDEIAQSACTLIEGRDCFETVRSLELAVGTEWTNLGTTMTYKTPKELFANDAAFRKALSARSTEAKIAAFPALAVLDVEAAAPLFARAAKLRTENSYAVSYEANLVRAIWMRWQELMAKQPPEFASELWLEGRFRFDALSDAQIAAIPFEAARPRIGRLDRDELAKLIKLHPALKSAETRSALFDELVTERPTRAAAAMIARSFIGDDRVGPIAVRLLDVLGADDYRALDLVIDAHHVPSLERIFGELEERRARKPLEWDPHHTDPELRPAIRAGFALGPKDASARFARYFEPGSMRTDADAKVAYDIWMLGTGRAVSHNGTELGTGDGCLLDLDPGWTVTFARFVNHLKLGKTAKRLLGVVPLKERKALIEKHAIGAKAAPQKKAATPAKKTTKKPAKKTTKKPAKKTTRKR